ncbi:3-hydroxyacyl-ACP dehydratase FabZ [Ammoniphilus sp. CFH 90114]|uniref:3-hydroxyacyl-ACP dehydratase FabZ n=1 Tax=Ammoniphilus sp. CFH 90114 TaxID=2493665 RepID=UPI00100FFFD3|nr:3-hydroxyacyl-ACP dehydratase FabZ [Ammoniphilus sp. CFH 90114]RXT13594.1 3-hydroxyacyl-ACP dehydratase FabZ [Ammoniphilus sp. CFH 90114]
MKPVLTYDEIRELLPQAYPMIMIDTVLELEPGERIIALKNVTGNEWMMPGHFPKQAIYPGIFIIEGLAQSSIVMLRSMQQEETEATYLLAGTKIRFVNVVKPGDQLHFTCSPVKIISTGGIVDCVATVNGETVAKGEISFAICP